jgi:hypothetical protein
MAAAPMESSFFRTLKQNSQNATNKAEHWSHSKLLEKRANDTLERVTEDLNEGILAKLYQDRLKQVEGYISQNCYESKQYNFL